MDSAKAERLVECESTVSDNHSADIIAIYVGKSEPIYRCGYHAMREGKTS